MPKLRPIVFFIVLLCITGCKPGFVDSDGAIDGDIAAKAQQQNTLLIKGLMSGDLKSLNPLISDSLRQSRGFRKGFREMSEIIRMVGGQSQPVVKRQFYANYPTRNTDVVIESGEGKDHDFVIRYRSNTRSSYVVITYLEDSIQTLSVFTIWNNYNGTWKLYSAYAGLVKALGKDAVDWYYKARQQYGDNALADAACSINMCMRLLTPGGDYLKYKSDADMRALVEQVKNTFERDYSFPLRVTRGLSAPEVFSLRSDIFDNSLCPVVCYTTSIPLTDTVSLSRECDSMNAHIGDAFNDIDHNNRYIGYWAFSQMPTDSSKNVPYYAFFKKSAAPWHY